MEDCDFVCVVPVPSEPKFQVSATKNSKQVILYQGDDLEKSSRVFDKNVDKHCGIVWSIVREPTW